MQRLALFSAVPALALLLGLMLSAPPPPPAAYAQTTPWNCADWMPFVHADRATAILESLAENRGKTLYCGLDQSDTFGKAETWAAGRDHNERDGTVYQGERGRFRGFIAAQEGWLTDGESGITGQSIAIIFEFPRQEKKRRRVKRLKISGDAGSCGLDDDNNNNPVTAADCPGGGRSTFHPTEAAARAAYVALTTRPGAADWQEWAARKAKAHCRQRGYPRTIGVTIATRSLGAAGDDANHPAWRYQQQLAANRAWQVRDWTAICIKRSSRR